MPDLLFATRNSWKVRLFTPSFQQYGFRVLSLGALPQAQEPPVETALTAVENALAKACHFHSSAHPWTFGDDAGLEIDALHGEPGLKARRWNDYFTDDVDDQTWLDYLLFRLHAVPLEARTASFVSGWALVAPDGNAYTRTIRWPFRIATRPIRPIAPGSPISAVRIGPDDDLASRQAEIRAEWARWGIFDKILVPRGEG